MDDKQYLLGIAVKAAQDRIELQSSYTCMPEVGENGLTGRAWVFDPDSDGESLLITILVQDMPNAGE